MEETIELWLCYNLHTFLRVNPSACREITNAGKIREYITPMVYAVPISNEYEDVIRKVLRTLSTCIDYGYEYEITMAYLFSGLAKAGREDLIAEAPMVIFRNGERVSDYIPKMDSKSVLKIINKVDWSKVEWDEKHLLALVRRLSIEDLKDLVSRRSYNRRRFMNKVRRMPRTMVSICRKLEDSMSSRRRNCEE